jgi:hypothetical protein
MWTWECDLAESIGKGDSERPGIQPRWQRLVVPRMKTAEPPWLAPRRPVPPWLNRMGVWRRPDESTPRIGQRESRFPIRGPSRAESSPDRESESARWKSVWEVEVEAAAERKPGLH